MGKVEFGGIFHEVVVSLKIIPTFALDLHITTYFLFAAPIFGNPYNRNIISPVRVSVCESYSCILPQGVICRSTRKGWRFFNTN